MKIPPAFCPTLLRCLECSSLSIPLFPLLSSNLRIDLKAIKFGALGDCSSSLPVVFCRRWSGDISSQKLQVFLLRSVRSTCMSCGSNQSCPHFCKISWRRQRVVLQFFASLCVCMNKRIFFRCTESAVVHGMYRCEWRGSMVPGTLVASGGSAVGFREGARECVSHVTFASCADNLDRG